MTQSLVFLKLGGSLITDKTSPRTALPDVLGRLAREIAAAREARPDLNLVLGHGSGSFGHVPARKYNTRLGVHTAQEWRGFAEVWKEAAALNHIVLDIMHGAGLPVVALPASAGMTAQDRQVVNWNVAPFQMALQAGLIPVLFGDVVFDLRLGGTIFSTEDMFFYLARQLRPQLILLAGREAGVWADFPSRTRLVELLTPGNIDQYMAALGSSVGTDVTGGMASKVKGMLALASALPGLQIRIFSGAQPGVLRQALLGAAVGTLLSAE